MYEQTFLVKNLKDIGVQTGDILVITCSLSEVGRLEFGFETLVNALIESVGETGGILGLSFNYGQKLPIASNSNADIFSRNLKPSTGGLNEFLVEHPLSIRSGHPMNSFVGIGECIRNLLVSHTPSSPCYDPVHKLAINNSGKMLLIGTLSKSPGITTVHVAQNLLGFKNLDQGRYGVQYYNDKGGIETYIRNDVGGCSIGFHNFYHHYRDDFNFKIMKIGDADSVLVNLHDALNTDLRVLQKNPEMFFCGRESCTKCRIDFWDFSSSLVPASI